MLLLFLAKWNALLAITQQHQKGKNSTQKNRSPLVHSVELSGAVVKVDIKVIKASLTQSQCLQCVTPPLTHVEILRPHDTTTPLHFQSCLCELTAFRQINWLIDDCIEQWWHDQVWQRPGPLPNRTEFTNFSERDLINNDCSFCLHILSPVYLQCNVFSF